jgi:hypothetical protein
MVRRIIERRGVGVNQNNPGPEDSGLVQLFFNPKSKISVSQMPANLVLDSLIGVMIEKKIENAVTLSDRAKIRCFNGKLFLD